MTTVEYSQFPKDRETHHVHGWTVSMLCHMFGIGGILLFMAEIEKPVLPNTFQWQVAIMEAPPAVEQAPAPSTPTPVPERQIEAATMRLRPILMTTTATVLGALPLALASGAGAADRRQIGVVLIGGLLVSTIVTLVLVPAAYMILSGRRE